MGPIERLIIITVGDWILTGGKLIRCTEDRNITCLQRREREREREREMRGEEGTLTGSSDRRNTKQGGCVESQAEEMRR